MEEKYSCTSGASRINIMFPEDYEPTNSPETSMIYVYGGLISFPGDYKTILNYLQNHGDKTSGGQSEQGNARLARSTALTSGGRGATAAGSGTGRSGGSGSGVGQAGESGRADGDGRGVLSQLRAALQSGGESTLVGGDPREQLRAVAGVGRGQAVGSSESARVRLRVGGDVGHDGRRRSGQCVEQAQGNSCTGAGRKGRGASLAGREVTLDLRKSQQVGRGGGGKRDDNEAVHGECKW